MDENIRKAEERELEEKLQRFPQEEIEKGDEDRVEESERHTRGSDFLDEHHS